MEISNLIKITILIAVLSSVQVFARAPDWRQENADLESQQADTANTNANTAAQKANTAAQKANTEAQSAHTAAQNAETDTQNANTAAQRADTATQNANTAARMITPVPAPKEMNVVPSGYVNCFMIKEGWFQGVWVPEHRVCQYNRSKEGVAWIEGYWACTKYKTTARNGECTNWIWKPGRWVRSFEAY